MVYILIKHEEYSYGAIDDNLYVFTNEEEANEIAEKMNQEAGDPKVHFYVEECEVIENGKVLSDL